MRHGFVSYLGKMKIDSLSDRQKLEEEFYERVLGYYNLAKHEQVVHLPGLRTESQLLEGTALHESIHAFFFARTYFGSFQKWLAIFLNEESLQEQHRQILKFLFKQSISASLDVHEGIATFVQFDYVKSQLEEGEAKDWLNKKPNLYRNSCLKFTEIVNALSLENVDDSFALELAEATMNTSIFDSISDLFLNEGMVCSREIQRENPIQRLDLIHQYLKNPVTAIPFSASIKDALKSVVKRSKPNVHTIEENDTIRNVLLDHINKYIFPVVVDSREAMTERIRNSFFLFKSTIEKVAPIGQYEYVIGPDTHYVGATEFRAADDDVPAYELQPYSALFGNLRGKESIINKKLSYYIHIFSPDRPKYPKLPDARLISVAVNCSETAISRSELVIYGSQDEIGTLLKNMEDAPKIIFVTSYLNRSNPEKRQFLDQLSGNIIYYLEKSTYEYLTSFIVQNKNYRKWTVNMGYFQKYDMLFLFLSSVNQKFTVFAPVTKGIYLQFEKWIEKQKYLKQTLKPLTSSENRAVNHFARFGY